MAATSRDISPSDKPPCVECIDGSLVYRRGVVLMIVKESMNKLHARYYEGSAPEYSSLQLSSVMNAGMMRRRSS